MSGFLSALPAIGQGITGLITTAINNREAKRREEDARIANKKQWNRQNDYNHPSAQMARLRQAGLNPNLIYGTSPSSAVGNAEAQAKAQAAQQFEYKNPATDIHAYANLQNTEAQTDNLRSQNTVNQQEALLKAAQTMKTAHEGSSAATKASIDSELRNTSAQLVREELRQSEQKSIQSEIATKVKDKSAQDLIMKIHYEALNARATLQGTHLQNKLKYYEAQLNELGLQKDDNFIFRILGKGYRWLDDNSDTKIDPFNNFKRSKR